MSLATKQILRSLIAHCLKANSAASIRSLSATPWDRHNIGIIRLTKTVPELNSDLSWNFTCLIPANGLGFTLAPKGRTSPSMSSIEYARSGLITRMRILRVTLKCDLEPSSPRVVLTTVQRRPRRPTSAVQRPPSAQAHAFGIATRCPNLADSADECEVNETNMLSDLSLETGCYVFNSDTPILPNLLTNAKPTRPKMNTLSALSLEIGRYVLNPALPAQGCSVKYAAVGSQTAYSNSTRRL